MLDGMKTVEKILGLLESQGWSQKHLETVAGLPTGRISKWVTGQGEPTLRQGLRIARLFNVSAEWLADDNAVSAEPAASLTVDESTVLTVFRDLGMSRQTAIRALTAAAKSANQGPAVEQPATLRDRPGGSSAEGRKSG